MALAQITVLDFDLSLSWADYLILLSAPFVGYNFIKFHLIFFNQSFKGFSFALLFISFNLIAIFSLAYAVFNLNFYSKVVLLASALMVILYCVPLPGMKINLRGFKGLKIHLVALSWVLVTVFLPNHMGGGINSDELLIYGLQRYLFVLAATLPFEIRDLNTDAPQLSTWPQRFGITKTKILGVFLLVAAMSVVYFLPQFLDSLSLIISHLILIALIVNVTDDQSKYYSSFWVEGIPILWLFLIYTI